MLLTHSVYMIHKTSRRDTSRHKLAISPSFKHFIASKTFFMTFKLEFYSMCAKLNLKEFIQDYAWPYNQSSWTLLKGLSK